MGRRLLLSLRMVFVLLGCAAAQSTAMFAQQVSTAAPHHDYEVAGSPLSASPVDKQIAAALREVSAEKIKTNIETLVAFKNRNTTSSTESDLAAGTGVLAAADWLRSQLGRYSQACQTDPDSQCVCGASRIRSGCRSANVPGYRAL
jgi:hypothetical protein